MSRPAGHYGQRHDPQASPCSPCPWSRYCKANATACGVFAQWVETGRVDRAAVRKPTHATFEALFEVAE